MEIEVKPVHIGHEIDKLRIERGLSKSEFGRPDRCSPTARQPYS